MAGHLEYLNDTETKTLLRSVNDTRDRAIISLYLTTGIFVNELLDLSNEHTDFDQKVLTVPGNRNRQIPLNSQATEALAQWTQSRPTTPVPYLFITQKGTVKKMSVRAIDKLIAKYSKQANFKRKINAKILRNTFAVNLFRDEKITLKAAGEILGISDYDSIKRYQQAAENPDQKQPLPSLDHTDTRPALTKIIHNLLPTKPQKQYSQKTKTHAPKSENTIYGRTTIIKEATNCLNKNQSVLLVGPLGIGKTHILKYITKPQPLPQGSGEDDFSINGLRPLNPKIIYFESPSPLKDMLIKILNTIDPDWKTKLPSRAPTKSLLTHVTETTRPNLPILTIDNLNKLRTADLEPLLTLLANFTVLAATDELTSKLKQLWWKFHRVEVKPLPEEASKSLIKHLTQDLTVSDYQLLETQLLNQAGGIPLALVDMTKQLSYKNIVTRSDMRSLNHSAGTIYRDWSFALIALWGAIVASRFVALGMHSFEGYILAGLGTSVLVVVRFFLFRMR